MSNRFLPFGINSSALSVIIFYLWNELMRRSHPTQKKKTGMSPRYLNLASALIDEIEQGTYPVGGKFPSELELSVLYSVSRFTTRGALDSLQKKGYITRRPKIGTIVVSTSPKSKYSISVKGTSDLLRFSRELDYQILGIEEITADLLLARDLECLLGAKWIWVSGCRVDPKTKQIVSLADYFIRPEHGDIVNKMTKKKAALTPIYDRIEAAAMDPVIEIRQEITAHVMSSAQAKLLGTQQDTPLLRVIHRMLGSQAMRPLYVIVSTYPAERFSFTQTLKLED